MQSLIIAASQLTPKVIFDLEKNYFEISGESIPENAAEFYNPIINWLKNYESFLYYAKNETGKIKPLQLNFKYDYFNSTSAKFILDIFFVFQKLSKEGYEVLINWHYRAEDTDMLESGEEFKSLCPNLTLNFISNN